MNKNNYKLVIGDKVITSDKHAQINKLIQDVISINHIHFISISHKVHLLPKSRNLATHIRYNKKEHDFIVWTDIESQVKNR